MRRINLQSFLTGSREMGFSELKLSFGWMNQDPLSRVGKRYVELSRFLNHIGDFRSFSFYDSIHKVFFPQSTWNWSPYSYAWKETYNLNACGHSFKAAIITETPVYTSHLGQKKRRSSYVIKKSTLFFLAKYFFWLCKWSVFRVHQNAFQKEKSYFFISRCFAVSYWWKHIFAYSWYTWHLKVFFLSYVLNNNPLITYRFCEMKVTFIVRREVTKCGFVNLCS